MKPRLPEQVTVALLAMSNILLTASSPANAYQKPASVVYTVASRTAPKSQQSPHAMSSSNQQAGTIKLPEGYTQDGDDSDGIFSIRDASGNRGYCDAEGNILIKPSEDDIRSVGNKRFIKRYYDDVQEVIELLGPGNNLIATLPQGMKVFGEKYCDGLLRVQTPGEELTGYLDLNGKFQIKPERFLRGKDFSSGFAQVEWRGHDNKTFSALINRTGKIVYGPLDIDKGERVTEFWEGIAIADTASGQGVLNTALKFVVPPRYKSIRSTNEKIYIAKRGDQLCVLSLNGKELKVFPKEVTNVRTEQASGNWIYAVGGNTARANEVGYGQSPKESKEGVISPKGKILIEPRYDQILEYADGKAVAGMQRDGRVFFGMVDSNGKVLLPFEYEKLSLKDAPAAIPVKTDKGKFNSNSFRENRTYRIEQWYAFLEDFDLIGMDEAELYRQLGAPDGSEETEAAKPYPKVITYSTVSGFCGNAWRGVRIELNEQKKVARWCMARFEGQDSWNTDNVVFIKNKVRHFMMDGRLVPKSAAKDYR